MKNVRALCALLLIVTSFAGSAFAFDTAPHFDLTRAASAERGFTDDAIKIVQLENWLTDYYSSSPTIPRAQREKFEKLHFDNLFTSGQVRDYWGRLLANLRDASKKAAKANDAFRMLVITGMGLHAVQDFYTHSNWVELHSRTLNGSYSTETFLYATANKSLNPGTLLYTGKYPADRRSGPGPRPVPAKAALHGGYDGGLNKDSPVRPRWDEAYVFAYAASHELLELLEQWTDETRPGFWKSVREYRVDEKDRMKLDYDLRALRNMSMWIKGKGQDGHWKGDKSGSARFFSAFSGKWVGKDSSRFVKAAAEGGVQDELVKDLYTDSAPVPPPSVGKLDLKKRAIILRVTEVSEIKNARGFPAPLAKAGGTDFYARITIGDQEYWDRTVQGSRTAADPWYVIHFIDQFRTDVPVRITVWDEDDTDSEKDRQMDINPLASVRDLSFNYRVGARRLSGDTSGALSGFGIPFASAGAEPDAGRASIKAVIGQSLLR